MYLSAIKQVLKGVVEWMARHEIRSQEKNYNKKFTLFYLVLFTVQRPSRVLQTIRDLYYIKCYVKMLDDIIFLLTYEDTIEELKLDYL